MNSWSCNACSPVKHRQSRLGAFLLSVCRVGDFALRTVRMTGHAERLVLLAS